MMRDGSPNREKTCFTYKAAVPSADISSLHGMNIDALVQSWSVTVRMESYPSDCGNFVMKSSAMVAKGSASGCG